MPPKLTPERIQEKLAELRAYVTDHVDVLRIRRGSTVLQKLRQTASKEEKAWIEFLRLKRSGFTSAHLQHLACTYDLINEGSARTLPGNVHERVCVRVVLANTGRICC